MTVDIAAGPAEDSAGNPSAAANQFSITTDLTPVPALPLAGAIVLGEAHPKWPPAIFAAGRGRVVRSAARERAHSTARPERRGGRTVRPQLAREAWSTGAEVAGAPWQTRRPPPPRSYRARSESRCEIRSGIATRRR